MTLPAAITLLLAPDTYLSLLFSPEYRVAESALIVLILGYLVSVILGPEGRFLRGIGRSRLVLYSNILLLVSNAALDALLIPIYGIVGAAIGTAGGVILSNLFGVASVYYTKRVYPYSLNTLKLLAGVLPAVVLGLILVEQVQSRVLLGILLPPLILSSYIITISLGKGFTQDDILVAEQFDRRLGFTLIRYVVR
jgi:O-antigen/teichoic acid export membrane protein